MSLADLFRDACTAYPNHAALRCGDLTWSHLELGRLADRLARGLTARGIRTGDRVATLLPNCPELALLDLSCFKLGAIAVPLNPRLKGAELAYILQHSQSRICIAEASLYPALAPVRSDLPSVEAYFIVGLPRPSDTEPFDVLAASTAETPAPPMLNSESPAAILYTSGSTARPKGATHSHGGLTAAVRFYVEAVNLSRADVVLGMLSMSHVFGFTLQLLAPLSVGGTVVISSDFAPARVLELIFRHRVTHLYGLPVMFDALSRHPAAADTDTSSLRYCLAGGDSVTPDLTERMRAVFGIELYEGCGMTEILPYALNRPPFENRTGSIGRPSVGMRVRVVDERGLDLPHGHPGEMLVQSEALMQGYWDDPEATGQSMQDGWFKTGDIGRCDEDGYYWFVGRSKEIIKRAGSKISPLEVEDVLCLHPAVEDIAVVGKPDAAVGERLAAFIVLKPDSSATVEELQGFAADQIATYKIPELYFFVPELPRGSTGKVHRNTLKEWAHSIHPVQRLL